MARRRDGCGCGCLALFLLWVVVAMVVREWRNGDEEDTTHMWIALAIVLGPILIGVPLVQTITQTWRESRLEKKLLGSSLEDLDLMEGSEFEEWIAFRLEQEGFRCKNLRDSRDFGLDVIAEKSGVRIGIQAKRYSDKVGNDAVQQASAGCQYHRCDLAAVVTQSSFTGAAEEQAERALPPVILIDRERLPDMDKLLDDAIRRSDRNS
ncbi:MAG: restriction endonuclease [Planctomycetota bacterium]